MKYFTISLTLLGIFCISQIWGKHIESARCGLTIWIRGANSVNEKNLIQAGRELTQGGRREPFYICRVALNGQILIGKLTKVNNGNSYCWVTDGKEEFAYDKEDYDALVEWDREKSVLEWKDSNAGLAPLDAFWAGQTSDGRSSIYIGQCTINLGYDQTIIPGNVIGSAALMNVPFNRQQPECVPERYLVCKQR